MGPTAHMSAQRGFTMVELVVTLIIVGILAAAAAPRFFDRRTYEARNFLDQTASLLRYAQKAAIAQRRTVCVQFTATAASLRIRATPDVGPCDTDLAGPVGGTPYTVTAPGQASYAAFPAAISFDALGRPNAAATIGVAGGLTLTVEAGTGYVYY